MFFTAWLWLSLAGFLIACWAALGTNVLLDFPLRELEVYCRRRKRMERFGRILDDHEDVALGSEGLQVLGTVLMVVGICLWLLQDQERLQLYQVAAAMITTSVLLLAGTIWLPWAFVRLWSAPFLYHTWSFWMLLHRLLWPLTIGAKLFDAFLHRLAGKPELPSDEEEAFEDEIRSMVTAGLRDGLLEADAREMIEGVIELGDVEVSDIMTPRSDVDALDIEMEWPAIMRFVVKCGRTRIPVYEGNLENILGILYVKDLLAELPKPSERRKSVRQLLREAWFVPETKPVDDLLQEFLNTRSHMAIVLDEFRSMRGVVTIEDALEEIVGEIVDESDKDEEVEIRQVNESTADILGRTHVDNVNELFGIGLPDSEEFDTIAGYLINQLGRIPKTGESIVVDGVRYTVREATPRRIERVRIEMLEPHGTNEV